MLRLIAVLMVFALLALPYYFERRTRNVGVTPAWAIPEEAPVLASAPSAVKKAGRPSAAALFEPSVRQEALYAFLYSETFPEWFREANEAESIVGRRLARPYPQDGDEEDRQVQNELRARLGIVGAVAETTSPKTAPLLLAVLKNRSEHWLVQRSALRGLQKLRYSFAGESERTSLLAHVDPRAITTAGLSDSDLMEKVMHE